MHCARRPCPLHMKNTPKSTDSVRPRKRLGRVLFIAEVFELLEFTSNRALRKADLCQRLYKFDERAV